MGSVPEAAHAIATLHNRVLPGGQRPLSVRFAKTGRKESDRACTPGQVHVPHPTTSVLSSPLGYRFTEPGPPTCPQAALWAPQTTLPVSGHWSRGRCTCLRPALVTQGPLASPRRPLTPPRTLVSTSTSWPLTSPSSCRAGSLGPTAPPPHRAAAFPHSQELPPPHPGSAHPMLWQLIPPCIAPRGSLGSHAGPSSSHLWRTWRSFSLAPSRSHRGKTGGRSLKVLISSRAPHILRALPARCLLPPIVSVAPHPHPPSLFHQLLHAPLPCSFLSASRPYYALACLTVQAEPQRDVGICCLLRVLNRLLIC